MGLWLGLTSLSAVGKPAKLFASVSATRSSGGLDFGGAFWLSEFPAIQIVLSGCTCDFLAHLSGVCLVPIPSPFRVAPAYKACEDFVLHHMPYNLHLVKIKLNSHVKRFEYTGMKMHCA